MKLNIYAPSVLSEIKYARTAAGRDRLGDLGGIMV